MSRSQPGSARGAAHPGQRLPTFASQPGTATAAEAARGPPFAPAPELGGFGEAGRGFFDPEGGSNGIMGDQEGGSFPAGAVGYYGAEAADPEGGGGSAAAAEGAAAAGFYGSGEYGGDAAAAALPEAAYYHGEGDGRGGSQPEGAASAAGAEYYSGTAAPSGAEGQYQQVDAGAGAVPLIEDAAAGEGQESYSPLAYLQALEAHLASLQQQRRELQQQLTAAAAGAYQQMSAQLGTASTGVPLPPDVPALVDELVVLHAVRQYLAYAQELQALTRHVEKAARALQQGQEAAAAEQLPGGVQSVAFLQDASDAVDSFSNAMGYAIAVKQLTEQGKMPIARLQQFATNLLSRVDTAQRSLRAVLSSAIQQRLAAAHWPPPLNVSGGDGGGGVAGTSWRGFAAAGELAAGELQQLLVLLTTLQRAAQHEQFSALSDASQEGPLLWVAEELAAPLAERLRLHFASGLPTDRPDHPEWLFTTALKAAQQCAPLAQELQPAVDAHHLQPWYSLTLELARAVHAVGMNPILRDHLLPQLVLMSDPPLWLHFADEAMRFEKRFAPLRGASLAPDLPEEEECLAAAHSASTLELLFQRPEWQEGWLGAEMWDASRQLDAACDSFSAWHPAVEQLLAVAGQEADMVPDTPRSCGGAAWRREFWPPVCAEQAASLVAGLVRRGGWVHEQAHRLQYSQAVPLALLRAYRERLSNLLHQAEQFRGMLGDTWLPRVGAAVCAAHYLEHQLSEPQGVLLLAELQDAASAGSASAAAAAGAGTAALGRAGSADEASGGIAGAHALANGGGKGGKGGRSLVSLIEREAGAFGSLRKQWAYKMAKQAVDAFHQLFTPYKRHVAAFSSGWEEGESSEDQAAAVAAAGPAAPSPAMLMAADSLQQLLRALAQHLDAVVFRDVWKSVALAVNYSLYNEVATEALFSPQGAAQLDADLSAVAAVFGEYTSRPAAHFKESREACRLLALPWQAALGLLRQLESQPKQAKQLLAPHGVKALNAEQAGVVLMQRLDILTAQSGGIALQPHMQPHAYGSSHGGEGNGGAAVGV